MSVGATLKHQLLWSQLLWALTKIMKTALRHGIFFYFDFFVQHTVCYACRILYIYFLFLYKPT